MRALGYPRLISMENFRTPNFELVADILYWMVKLYDPDTTISDRVEFENERVEFLTSIAALLASKARLKLNTKKFYASDGKAVQELLKLATLLYKATKVASRRSTEDDTPPPPIKMQDVKTARVLASEITASGAKLYDLLEGEATERLDRGRALRFLDTAAAGAEGSREQQIVERKVRDIIENTRQGVEDAKKEAEELAADQRNLESKISKKQEELERTEKRLKSLENVRPQFLEEAEKLEKDLQRHYELYLDKQRNLDYLESELDKFRRAEEEQMEEQERRLKKMRERLLKEEVDLMRGGDKGTAGGNGSRGGIASSGRSQQSQVRRGDSDGESSEEGSESNDEDDADRGSGKPRGPVGNGNRGATSAGARRGVAESDDDEELSVNDRNNRNRAGSSSTGGRVGAGGSSIGGKSGGSSSGGRGVRMDDHTSDDFLDDEEDEDDDGGEDEGEGEFSNSDEEDF